MKSFFRILLLRSRSFFSAHTEYHIGNYLASVAGKVPSPCIGGFRVSVGIEVTAEEPQEEEPARVCRDSERIDHGQAERLDLVLHIWS